MLTVIRQFTEVHVRTIAADGLATWNIKSPNRLLTVEWGRQYHITGQMRGPGCLLTKICSGGQAGTSVRDIRMAMQAPQLPQAQECRKC
jgi:hypothetical protein